MKQYQGSVIVVKSNEIETAPFTDRIVDNIPFTTGEEAEKEFLDLCREYLSNFDEYTKEDIDTILENGYESFGTGFVAIYWFV